MRTGDGYTLTLLRRCGLCGLCGLAAVVCCASGGGGDVSGVCVEKKVEVRCVVFSVQYLPVGKYPRLPLYSCLVSSQVSCSLCSGGCHSFSELVELLRSPHGALLPVHIHPPCHTSTEVKEGVGRGVSVHPYLSALSPAILSSPGELGSPSDPGTDPRHTDVNLSPE